MVIDIYLAYYAALDQSIAKIQFQIGLWLLFLRAFSFTPLNDYISFQVKRLLLKLETMDK